MRMHPVRADQRSARRVAAGATFLRDGSANFASAALPLVLGTLGMALLGMGAILSMTPVALAGIGLAVLAFGIYLVAVGMDSADRRARERRETKAQAARQAFQQDVRQEPSLRPRSPLADEAVAALSGESGGGIYPPLRSAPKAAPARAPEQPVSVWAPGAKVTPEGWDDGEVVEFSEVREEPFELEMPVAATVAGPARPAVARPDAAQGERDFRVWPGSKDLDSWTTFTGERRPQASRFSEEEIKRSMDERRRQMAGRLPTVGAILADVGMKETDMERMRREADRGKCSQCEAIIWAPKKRPIVLKCPGCGHKAKLY